MRTAIFPALAAAVMSFAAPAIAQLDQITGREAATGLKAALERGSQAAVVALGKDPLGAASAIIRKVFGAIR